MPDGHVCQKGTRKTGSQNDNQQHWR